VDASSSAGCGVTSPLPIGQAVERTLTFGGRERTYRARLPSGYDGRAVPLVIVLHGGGGSGLQIETNQAGFDPIADREGFAVVYPDGVESSGPLGARTWNAGTCCGFAQSASVDDIGFVTTMLDQLEADACIDRSRVFATGMSNGAMLAYRIACERADRIAAIAPVAGSMMFAPCAPNRRVAVFHVHGTEDNNVPYSGGTGCGAGMVQTAPIPDVVAQWATFNQCSSAPSTVFAQGDGTCVSSGTCAAETVLCSIANGNHTWPAGAGNDGSLSCGGSGAKSTTFLASEAIWQFFARNARPN
jgi:polyhydroxybutyrate depolymerase